MERQLILDTVVPLCAVPQPVAVLVSMFQDSARPHSADRTKGQWHEHVLIHPPACWLLTPQLEYTCACSISSALSDMNMEEHLPHFYCT